MRDPLEEVKSTRRNSRPNRTFQGFLKFIFKLTTVALNFCNNSTHIGIFSCDNVFKAYPVLLLQK